MSAKIKAGYLDLVVLKHSAAVNYYTSINLTKLDVLDTFSSIRVAVAYCTANGEKLTSFPADLSLLEKCTVEYIDFPGWQNSTKGARAWSDLPSQAQRYVEFIEASLGIKVGYIGTGPNREDMIIRE
jgi:adenylosuccinate synthase